MKYRSAIAVLTALTLVSASCTSETEPVDYVNPYIGNISHLLVPTFPTVQLPNSLLRVYPERADSVFIQGSAFRWSYRCQIRPLASICHV